jgi:hypothetical protein
LDVAFIFDNTSSMAAAPLQKFREGLSTLLDDLQASAGNDLRLALVTPDDDQVNVRMPFPAPGNNNRVAFENLVMNGNLNAPGIFNDNCPESTDECLNTVVNGLPASGRTNPRNCTPDSSPLQIGDFNQGFRSNARKIVVMITDAPTGGFCDDGGDNGVRAAIYAQQARNFPCIKINAVHVEVGGSPACPAGFDPVAQTIMLNYAQTTCGWFSQVRNTGEGITEAVARMLHVQGACQCP